MQPDLSGLLAAAQLRVGGTRALLARPRDCNLEECVALLREAQGYLEWLRDSLSTAPPVAGNLRAQALALLTEIRQAGVLLDRAARFGRRTIEILQSRAGYTAAGTFPPWQPGGRTTVFG